MVAARQVFRFSDQSADAHAGATGEGDWNDAADQLRATAGFGWSFRPIPCRMNFTTGLLRAVLMIHEVSATSCWRKRATPPSCIVQFGSGNDDVRTPVLHFAEQIELLDFDTLDAMIQETYVLWQEVVDERDAAMRRGTGTSGPLL